MIDADVDEEEAALGQGGPDQIEERRDHEEEERARRDAAGHRRHLATLGARKLGLLLAAPGRDEVQGQGHEHGDEHHPRGRKGLFWGSKEVGCGCVGERGRTMMYGDGW